MGKYRMITWMVDRGTYCEHYSTPIYHAPASSQSGKQMRSPLPGEPLKFKPRPAQTRSKVMSFNVTPAEKKGVMRYAKEWGMSLSELTRAALEAYLLIDVGDE